jgi:hypothetical protein
MMKSELLEIPVVGEALTWTGHFRFAQVRETATVSARRGSSIRRRIQVRLPILASFHEGLKEQRIPPGFPDVGAAQLKEGNVEACLVALPS